MFFLVMSVFKKLLKVALILGLIFLILFFVTRGSITDYNLIKEKIPSNATIVLLEVDGEIATGFVKDKEFDLLIEEIPDINEKYILNKYDKILGDNYKLFIFDVELFLEMEDIVINNKDVTTQQIYDLYTTELDIFQITVEDLLLTVDTEERDMKALMLAYLYENELKMTKSPIIFFKNYKNGLIKVYPDSMFFKLAKFVPLSWVEEKINKLKDSVTE